jgi:hypothetical protein
LPNRISIYAKVFSWNKNKKNPNSPDFEGNTIWFCPPNAFNLTISMRILKIPCRKRKKEK